MSNLEGDPVWRALHNRRIRYVRERERATEIAGQARAAEEAAQAMLFEYENAVAEADKKEQQALKEATHG